MKARVTQLAVGGFDDNFSYVVYDEESGDTALVDPCGDANIIANTVAQLKNIRPRYILLTHGHHDHTSAVSTVKDFFPAIIAAHPHCRYAPELKLADREKLSFGNGFIRCLYTPGHTTESVCYQLSDNSALFTGDTLFIDWIGYCDAQTMYKTLQEVIYPLPDELEVYSGHNYGREKHAPLGVEKKRNAYLAAENFAAFNEALKSL